MQENKRVGMLSVRLWY